MRVGIQMLGPTKRTVAFIENFSVNARQAVRQTFFKMGRDLVKRTRKDINDGRKTGNWYRVYVGRGGVRLKKSRWHQASGAYETHANITGNLRDSLGFIVRGTNSMEFGYGATGPGGKPVPSYAADVEYGHPARNGTWVYPRPSIQNNIKGTNFQKYFDEALRSIEGK